ncbi:MAG TPA: DUF4010 domain-containing protein [Roseiflexaceae bacterium]|nr:DUF4010 domain-containing protein [Roseiflexaceae bacterium]
MIPEVFQTLGIALGLGLLVGLQRERSRSRWAGIRTFPIITLLGSICGLLAASLGGWVIAAGFLAVISIVVMANVAKIQEARLMPDQLGKAADGAPTSERADHARVRTQPVDADSPHGSALRDAPSKHAQSADGADVRSLDSRVKAGQTTEAAALLMYALGAYLAVGNPTAAIVVAGVVAVLLHWKQPLHRFVDKIGEQDIHAVMQFVLIALVIYPVLPDQTYGPYDVLNPREIWRVVVLIVGIGLAGYVAYKLFGRQAGTLLGGVLGGLISSTATTVSYARRAKSAPDTAALAALVIVIASSIAFARVIVEIAIVAPGILGQVAPPLGAMFVLMVLISAGTYILSRGGRDEMPEQENPAELKSALIFGVIYTVVIFAVAAAKDYFGTGGLYVVALISGLTDVDAITLSTARLAAASEIDIPISWRVILLASLANLVFKAGTVAVLGSPQLTKRIAVLFGIAIVGGLLIFWLWPSDLVLPSPR